MALKGDLASVDLAQVFQMLALNQKVGLLSIQAPRAWRALYFDPRGVTLYYNQHSIPERAIGVLERCGRLVAESVREAREHAASNGLSVVETLLSGGFLSQDEFEEAMRSQIEEEIYDLFFWKEARFEFLEGATTMPEREGVINERFFFSTDSLIMEAARLIDEWSFIQERVPGPLEVYRATASGSRAADQNGLSASLLELADGKRNVARLIEVLGMQPFQVYKALAQLLDAGLVEAVAPQDLIPSAQECANEGRLPDAVNLYEKAISIGEGIPDVHEMLAAAYEMVQEYELAAQQLKLVAEYYIDKGDIAAAGTLLLKSSAILPTDLAACDRLVGLTIGTKVQLVAGFDPVAEGKRLVDLYLEVGEIDRVRTILERLLRDNPADLELKKSLINVHTKAGDTKRVVELYESIANDLVVARCPIEAIKYLQKILLVDRSRSDISDRIRSLYELDERSRSRRRVLFACGIMFCFVTLVGVLWYFYERHARDLFERIDTTREIAAMDFDAAVRKYETFLKDYPLTVVSQGARAELEKIASLRMAHDAQLENERKAIDEKLRRIRVAYRAQWERYGESARADALDQACEALEQTRKLVLEAGQEDDRRWALEKALEKSLLHMRDFLAEAKLQERKARTAMASGDWQGARSELLKLLDVYGKTSEAKNARLPVRIVSRPPGATIWSNGAPWPAPPGGASDQRVETPALLELAPAGGEPIELRKEGFEPRVIKIDPKTEAVVEVVLRMRPIGTLRFEQPCQTAPGIGRGYIISGLRGGHLGIASKESGVVLSQTKLPGLVEVAGTPAVTADRVCFRTNEGGITCHALPNGNLRWKSPLTATPVHDPIIKDGRVLIGDDHGVLHCFDAGNGRQIWHVQLDGSASGAPFVEARYVRIGSGPSELLLIDAADGTIANRLKVDAAVTSDVCHFENLAIVGLSDGKVVAVDEQTGRTIWRHNVGRAPLANEVRVVGASVLAIGHDDVVKRLDARTGEVKATKEGSAWKRAPGRRMTGPLATGTTLFLVAREEVGKGQQRDVLRAFDLTSFELVWEFQEGGTFIGQPTTDGSTLALINSEGKVLLFQ